MWTKNSFTQRLGLDAPIVQGPFGGGYSTAKLAAAVSNAGALGSVGAGTFSPAQITEIITDIRAATNKPFNINLWVPIHGQDDAAVSREEFEKELATLRPMYSELNVAEPAYPSTFGQPYEHQVEAVLAAKPAVFSFVMGVPDAAILREARKQNIFTLGTATTVEEALALEAAGVDGIVASGTDAGGHRSTFLRAVDDSLVGTMSLVPQVTSAVKIPVIAAGGIVDGRGIAAALALGASGAQVGTAFLATPESGAPPTHRALLGTSDARITKLTTAFSGRHARGIANAFMSSHTASLKYPARNFLTTPLRRAAVEAGRTDLLGLWAGQSASLARHVGASELVKLLVTETNAAISKLGT